MRTNRPLLSTHPQTAPPIRAIIQAMEQHSRKTLIMFAVIVVLGAIVAAAYFFSSRDKAPEHRADVAKALSGLEDKTGSNAQRDVPLTPVQAKVIETLGGDKPTAKSLNDPAKEKSILNSLQ